MPLTMVDKVLRCECGFEAIGSTDADLVAAAQRHARAAHGLDVSADLVLALARPQRRQPKDAPPAS